MLPLWNCHELEWPSARRRTYSQLVQSDGELPLTASSGSALSLLRRHRCHPGRRGLHHPRNSLAMEHMEQPRSSHHLGPLGPLWYSGDTLSSNATGLCSTKVHPGSPISQGSGVRGLVRTNGDRGNLLCFKVRYVLTRLGADVVKARCSQLRISLNNSFSSLSHS